jgi:anthranilate phosphoribosyltransferase
MAGGDPGVNAAITREILSGRPGAKRDVILINAGAALLAAGKVDNLKAGIRMAAEAIDEGQAAAKLDALVAYTQENG